MAAIIEETNECLCEDYSDHNISNNGQHIYRPCHEISRPVQHDKLFIVQEVTSFDVHGGQLENKTTDRVDTTEGRNEDSKTEDTYKKDRNVSYKKDRNVCDDAEIIIYLEKGSEEIRVGVVSNTYTPEHNQNILSATFEIPDARKCYDRSKKCESDLDEKRKLEKCNITEEIKTDKEAKHVHFQEQSFLKHRSSLRSHKMEKDSGNHISHEDNAIDFLETFERKDRNKEADHTDEGKSVNKTSKDTTFNAIPYNLANGSEQKANVHTQKTTSFVSSSECDLRRNRNARLKVSDNKPNEKKIILLRRDSENKTPLEHTQTKTNESNGSEKDRNSAVQNNKIEIHQKQSNNLRNYVQISSSLSTASHCAGGDINDARRSKSTVNADDLKNNDKRERAKIKRKLKSRKKRQYKNKVPKTEKEIFQRQIETGQLRSMFSRYKTEGLRFLQLEELLHKGTFSTKYKASFQNKQVVLTIYGEDITDDINAIDMAHMGSSYFVLGFSDCMTGPYGSVWFMSMYHSLGDLQSLLSRDSNRKVIGERQAQFITAGILIGVDFLHQHDIIHGNIKPSKVLINALGYPVLTGFVKMEDNPDREGNKAYTPAYVAPEHLRGNRSEAIDIFSVGCMAYEIITGWTPFDGETREQTLLNIQKACRPLYDPQLFSFAGEFFIDSCLRRNQKERFCIGEERCNLIFEEWFSTLNWRNFRRQTLISPLLDAIQQIQNRATLSWEEKTVQFKWGEVMDVMSPYSPSLESDGDVANLFLANSML